MNMRRTLPPAAAPLHWNDLFGGLLGLFSGARYSKRLQRELKEYFKAEHLFGVSSGKAALTLILLGMKSLSSKKRVVVPAYTCFSVLSAVLKAGLEVVPCDIDPATLDFNYPLLEETINEETLCVVSTHLLGLPSDLDRVRRLCRERGVYLVEDAAQAMGGTYRGEKLGTLGDAGFFSFGRGKNITCGSGGLILTNSDLLAEKIGRHHARLREPGFFESAAAFLESMLTAFFIRPALYWLPAALPFLKLGQTFFHPDFPMEKLSGMKAALLLNWKERLEGSSRTRGAVGGYFKGRLSFKTPSSKAGDVSYLRFPVLSGSREERDRLLALLQREGLGAGGLYPTPINEIHEVKHLFEGKTFPGAKEVAERLFTLPTHPFVSETDREKICKLLENAEGVGPVSEKTPDSLRLQCG